MSSHIEQKHTTEFRTAESVIPARNVPKFLSIYRYFFFLLGLATGRRYQRAVFLSTQCSRTISPERGKATDRKWLSQTKTHANQRSIIFTFPGRGDVHDSRRTTLCDVRSKRRVPTCNSNRRSFHGLKSRRLYQYRLPTGSAWLVNRCNWLVTATRIAK